MSPLRSLPGRLAHPFYPNEFDHQLEMIRPSTDSVELPHILEGYQLRQFQPQDESAYGDLFHLAFEDEGRLAETREGALPEGFFVIEHLASHDLVSSCVALRGSNRSRHPDAGQLGWLVTDPAHAGHGLGTIVAASVTNRLAAEGYHRPFLGTEDFRIAAISIYLNLGWRPHLYRDDMQTRWKAIFARLGRAFVS